MNLEELLKQRIEEEKYPSEKEYYELGMFGENYCEFEEDEDDEDE